MCKEEGVKMAQKILKKGMAFVLALSLMVPVSYATPQSRAAAPDGAEISGVSSEVEEISEIQDPAQLEKLKIDSKDGIKLADSGSYSDTCRHGSTYSETPSGSDRGTYGKPADTGGHH